MPKSTPGPWQVKRYANHELQTDFVMVVIGDRVHMIGYSDEDEANARLIAAAPQMLEALEAIIKRFQPEQHDAAGCMFKNCELCKAIAVIKAAKGEA